MKIYQHHISIPTLLDVNEGNLTKLGSFANRTGKTHVVLFFGDGIRDLFGKPVIDSLTNENIDILHIYEEDNNSIDCLLNFAFSIPATTEMIIGIGGGKVLDIAKYVSFLNDIPFISVPTSTSNDGFSSSGCSLFIDGRRRSVSAKMPFGIIVDLNVIKSSPQKLIYSGVGDLISKITAVFDWEFEEQNGITKIDDFAAMISKKSVNSIVRMDIKKDVHDEFFLRELVDSLIMSGVAMEIARNSAPASGSEHLISHGLDQLAENPQLHGIQVGVATYLMSLVQSHRSSRVAKFLDETGFFEHVKKLKMKAADFERAIDNAPSFKPYRYTYIHLEENRKLAKEYLNTDPILKEILI